MNNNPVPQVVSITHGTAGPTAENQTHVVLKFNVTVDQLAFTPAEAIDVASKMFENARRLDSKSVAGWTYLGQTR